MGIHPPAGREEKNGELRSIHQSAQPAKNRTIPEGNVQGVIQSFIKKNEMGCSAHVHFKSGAAGNVVSTARSPINGGRVADAMAASRFLCDWAPASRNRSTPTSMISHQNFRFTCKGAILIPTLRAGACSTAPLDSALLEVSICPAPLG
jgi:hypothetical protein